MGMILTPNSGQLNRTLDQIFDSWRQAGFTVSVERERARCGVIEQILLEYGRVSKDPKYKKTRVFDLRIIDSLISRYRDSCEAYITDPSSRHQIRAMLDNSVRLRFSECFPGDDDDNTRLVTKLAKVLDYNIEGE